LDNELIMLQAVRLKGRATVAEVAPAVGAAESAVTRSIEQLKGRGLFEEAAGRVRLTPAGRQRLTVLLDVERQALDGSRLRDAYERFAELNGRFKRLAIRWQLRDDDINDHTDGAYDGPILAELTELDGRLHHLLHEVIDVASRLVTYPVRFSGALGKVHAGEHKWMLSPLIDSYHTIWFELHEELIELLGLSRQAEAASGRAE
jgi:pyruvate,orthophosphate dikinase